MNTRIVNLRPEERVGAMDSGAMARLEKALGPKLVREMLEDAQMQATERLAALESALEEGDWDKVRRCAQRLMDTPARLGMRAIGLQARALRDLCADGDLVAAGAVAARLIRTGRAALLAEG